MSVAGVNVFTRGQSWATKKKQNIFITLHENLILRERLCKLAALTRREERNPTCAADVSYPEAIAAIQPSDIKYANANDSSIMSLYWHRNALTWGRCGISQKSLTLIPRHHQSAASKPVSAPAVYELQYVKCKNGSTAGSVTGSAH